MYHSNVLERWVVGSTRLHKGLVVRANLGHQLSSAQSTCTSCRRLSRFPEPLPTGDHVRQMTESYMYHTVNHCDVAAFPSFCRLHRMQLLQWNLTSGSAPITMLCSTEIPVIENALIAIVGHHMALTLVRSTNEAKPYHLVPVPGRMCRCHTICTGGS